MGVLTNWVKLQEEYEKKTKKMNPREINKYMEQFIEKYTITEEEFYKALDRIEEHNKETKRKFYEDNKDKFVNYPEFDVLYDEIVEFSELGEFIDAPLKSSSSGMKSRLGFSIATAVKPDVLILDEVLSVGDAAFKAKSEQRVLDMMSQGVTVLFVSHSADTVKRICNKAIILSKGQLVAEGEVNEICDIYTEMVNSR